jgi:hypothetical protein
MDKQRIDLLMNVYERKNGFLYIRLLTKIFRHGSHWRQHIVPDEVHRTIKSIQDDKVSHAIMPFISAHGRQPRSPQFKCKRNHQFQVQAKIQMRIRVLTYILEAAESTIPEHSYLPKPFVNSFYVERRKTLTREYSLPPI